MVWGKSFVFLNNRWIISVPLKYLRITVDVTRKTTQIWCWKASIRLFPFEKLCPPKSWLKNCRHDRRAGRESWRWRVPRWKPRTFCQRLLVSVWGRGVRAWGLASVRPAPWKGNRRNETGRPLERKRKKDWLRRVFFLIWRDVKGDKSVKIFLGVVLVRGWWCLGKYFFWGGGS